jgi:hypothetical protein
MKFQLMKQNFDEENCQKVPTHLASFSQKIQPESIEKLIACLVVLKLKSIMSLRPSPLNMELIAFNGIERKGTVNVNPN